MRPHGEVRRTVGLLVLMLALGCRAAVPVEDVEATLAGAMASARALVRDGRDAEAAELVYHVLRVDAEYDGAQELLDTLPPDAVGALGEHPLLGSNVAKRLPAERSLAAKIVLYLPDRLLDLLDLASFDVHLGPGLFANVHLTRGFQLGAGARGVSGLGWHDHRSLGLLVQAETGFALPFVEGIAFAGGAVGSSGIDVVNETGGGMPRPSDAIYQRLRDYWAVGAAVTVLLVGADIDLHPIELYDFVLGFATLDPLRDDFAGTRGLDMPTSARDRLWELAKITMSEETLAQYRASKGAASER